MKRKVVTNLVVLAVLMIAFAPAVSAETVGDLQKEEKGIIVDYEYSQASELIDLGNRMVSKRDEIREFEKCILPNIQITSGSINSYVSIETTDILFFFARNLLEKNGTYSPAEQVLEIQLQELENKGINESAEMHIFYVQKIYNSVVNIGNELDRSIKSMADKLYDEQENQKARDFAKQHPLIDKYGDDVRNAIVPVLILSTVLLFGLMKLWETKK